MSEITLYKYYKVSEEDKAEDVFYNTEVMTERKLRERFIEEYNNFDKSLLKEYSLGDNAPDDVSVWDIDIFVILTIFNENSNHTDEHIYYVELFDTRYDEYEDCFD